MVSGGGAVNSAQGSQANKGGAAPHPVADTDGRDENTKLDSKAQLTTKQSVSSHDTGAAEMKTTRLRKTSRVSFAAEEQIAIEATPAMPSSPIAGKLAAETISKVGAENEKPAEAYEDSDDENFNGSKQGHTDSGESSGGSSSSEGESDAESSGDDDASGDDDKAQKDADELRASLGELPSGWMGALLAGGKLGPKPLHAAAANDDVEELERLLGPDGEFHDNVDACDPFDYTPLIVAAESGSVGAVATLLKYGADKEAASKMHNSRALHYACMEGRPQICHLLLDAGCDVDPRTDDLRTPLFQAAFRNRVECVRILLLAGAELVPSRDGRTPLDVATDDTVVQLLKDSNQPPAKKPRTGDP